MHTSTPESAVKTGIARLDEALAQGKTITQVILSSNEAAWYLGLGESTLRAYRSAGTGPRFYKIGRRVLYDLAELDRWLHDLKTEAEKAVAKSELSE